MKRSIIVLSMCVAFVSCSRRPDVKTVSPVSYIPVDSANKMISSYINSINYASNDSDIRSWSIDMDQLRLLVDSSNPNKNISHLKIALAHNLDYINSGHLNSPAGYNKNALTLVIAGYDDLGNYIYLNANSVQDRARPCPSNCPPGNAASDLLVF